MGTQAWNGASQGHSCLCKRRLLCRTLATCLEDSCDRDFGGQMPRDAERSWVTSAASPLISTLAAP